MGGAFPDQRRVLATTAAVAPLARHAGAVDEILVTEPLGPVGWVGPPPDVAVNLHGRGPQSHRALLALAPRRIVAFANATVGVAGPRWRVEEHEVHRWCRLLTECGIPADPNRLDIEPPDVAPGPAQVPHRLLERRGDADGH